MPARVWRERAAMNGLPRFQQVSPEEVQQHLSRFAIPHFSEGVTGIKVFEALGTGGLIKMWIGVEVKNISPYWLVYWGAEHSIKLTKGTHFTPAEFTKQAYAKLRGSSQYQMTHEYIVLDSAPKPQPASPHNPKPAPTPFAIDGSPDWDF